MIIVHRENDHLNIRVFFADLRKGLDPVHDGHLNIQQDHIRLQVFE